MLSNDFLQGFCQYMSPLSTSTCSLSLRSGRREPLRYICRCFFNHNPNRTWCHENKGLMLLMVLVTVYMMMKWREVISTTIKHNQSQHLTTKQWWNIVGMILYTLRMWLTSEPLMSTTELMGMVPLPIGGMPFASTHAHTHIRLGLGSGLGCICMYAIIVRVVIAVAIGSTIINIIADVIPHQNRLLNSWSATSTHMLT